MKDTLKIRDKILLTLIILTSMGINRIAEGGEYPAKDISEKQVREDGIDFTGRGNEPFWSLAIDFEKGIQFRTMEGLKIETASLAIHQAQDAPVTRISGQNESAELIITIIQETCNDTMADEVFRYSVAVEVNMERQEESKVFKGCGDYAPDYRLHDIWVLVAIDEEPIESYLNENKGNPVFEVFVEEGRVSGHLGCNNFNVGFYRTGVDQLYFEEFAVTRMMCEDMELEERILKSVPGRILRYRLDGNMLILENYEGIQLNFKKVD